MSQGRWRIVTVAFVSLIVLAGGFVDTAGAQPSPIDPAIETYRQLLSEANDRAVTMGGQVQKLEHKN